MCMTLSNMKQIINGYNKIVYKVVYMKPDGRLVSRINNEFIWFDTTLASSYSYGIGPKTSSSLGTIYFIPKEKKVEGLLSSGSLSFSEGLLHAFLKRPTKSNGGEWLGPGAVILPMTVFGTCIVNNKNGTIAATRMIWRGEITAMGTRAFDILEQCCRYKDVIVTWPQIISKKSDNGYKFKVCNW